MPNSVEKLETEAVKAALNKQWKEAVKINLEIIDFDKENVPALNRLAKAYIELEKYDDAKKYVKSVLKIDPINQTAKKNMELAEGRKKQFGSAPLPDLKTFIKEPGTTKEFTLGILTKGLTTKKFYSGEPLIIHFDHHKVEIQKTTGELVSVLDPVKAENLLDGKKKGADFYASFLGQPGDSEKEITILVKSSFPIFKTEKQDIKPYFKRDIEESDQDQSSSDQEEPSL